LRIVKAIIGLVVIAVALVIGFAVYRTYRPDLWLTALNRHISFQSYGERWGIPIPLIPDVFAVGTSRTEIEQSLRQSGFDEPSFAWKGLKPSFEGGEVVTREADGLVCVIRYYVVTKYDEADKLTNAEALVHEHGCL
jgi:hypothetical protein